MSNVFVRDIQPGIGETLRHYSVNYIQYSVIQGSQKFFSFDLVLLLLVLHHVAFIVEMFCAMLSCKCFHDTIILNCHDYLYGL